MSDIFGWIGAILVILAYFLVSTKKLPPTAVTYQLMNLFGAIGIGINAYVKGATPSIATNIVWSLIAI